MPRSMPTNWITVNCPSLSWQRKRENDKDKLDCRSRLHVQRNVCLSPLYLYLSCLSFCFQCLLLCNISLHMSSYSHLSSPISSHCIIFLFFYLTTLPSLSPCKTLFLWQTMYDMTLRQGFIRDWALCKCHQLPECSICQISTVGSAAELKKTFYCSKKREITKSNIKQIWMGLFGEKCWIIDTINNKWKKISY